MQPGLETLYLLHLEASIGVGHPISRSKSLFAWSGSLIIDGCVLQCESHPLDHLSHAIVTTADNNKPNLEVSSVVKTSKNSVSVTRSRIEGGAKAVLTSGTLSLQQVRVIYTRTSLFFWFNVSQKPVLAQG